MSLTKLAETAAQIRKSKGFHTPDRFGLPSESEAEIALAGMAAYVRVLSRTAEDVRKGNLALCSLQDVLGERLADADSQIYDLNPNVREERASPGRPDAMLAKLMLVVTEVAEAMDAVVEGDEKNFAEELADVLIRVFDIAGTMGINLDFEVSRKTSINAMRPRLHGKLA